MTMISIDRCGDTRTLVCRAHEASEPVILVEEGEDRLVAMSPPVFERLVVEGEQLARVDRRSLRF